MGEVALSYKYKYSTDVMEVDATWDIQPLAAASPTMWVGLFKEGAPLTEVCRLTLHSRLLGGAHSLLQCAFFLLRKRSPLAAR